MRRLTVLVVMLAASSARADEISAGPFVSAGLVLSGGSRGLTIGVEASGGWVSDETGAYAGAAIGFDYAPNSHDLPIRLYVEGEGGWLAFGVGVGPAWFFDGEPVGLQITPYAALAPGTAECGHHEPFGEGGAFYRFTHIEPGGVSRNLHEGGVFAKALTFPDGADSHGVCTH